MRIATLACAAAVLAAAPAAHGQTETGRVNVHLNLALAASPSSLGLMGNVGIDWQFVPPLALDVNLGGGHLGLLAGSGGEPGFFVAAAGLRFRFVDRPGGDGYVVPRVGYLINRTDDNSYATTELEAGAEFTVDGPVRLGPYVRVAGAFGPGPNLVYFCAGINLSAVALRRAPPKPKPKPKSQLGWTPREDDEGDDRVFEEPPPPAPPPPVDSDGDGIADADDACPDTKPGSKVDARGCVILEQQMVLEGITFALDSAEIQPASEEALARAAQLLRDNASARVEIAGHTCDLGSDEYNLKLSQARAAAVADWLVAHGIERSRLEVRGYGNTQPKMPNDSEEHRALNRRIEFRRLDR